MRRSVPIVLAVSILVGLSGAVRAASDTEEIESLIRQGVSLRNEGKDERALPFFQKAYAKKRTPRSAGQLGLCEMAVGYWVESEKHLTEALNVPEHPWVAKNLAMLTSMLSTARTNIGELTIEGEPAGAEVLVNGVVAGRLPLTAPVRLNKGAVDVEVRSPGFVTASRGLRLKGGDSEKVTIVLTAEAAPASASPAPVAVAPPKADAPPTDAAVPTPVAAPEPAATLRAAAPERPARIAAWSTAIGAGAALALGVVETFVWRQKIDAFDNHEGSLPSDPIVKFKDCGSKDPSYGGAGCRELHDQLATARLLSLVGYGVAGALAVTSAILFVRPHDGAAPSDAAMTCGPDLANRGAGCRFSF